MHCDSEKVTRLKNKNLKKYIYCKSNTSTDDAKNSQLTTSTPPVMRGNAQEQGLMRGPGAVDWLA